VASVALEKYSSQMLAVEQKKLEAEEKEKQKALAETGYGRLLPSVSVSQLKHPTTRGSALNANGLLSDKLLNVYAKCDSISHFHSQRQSKSRVCRASDDHIIIMITVITCTGILAESTNDTRLTAESSMFRLPAWQC
jgi:hypothetical protein